jgi:hypothetical protein
MKDTKGYVDDTKADVQAEQGYADNTAGYVTEASTSCPCLYHLGQK